MKRREARELAFKLTYEMIITGAYNEQTRIEMLQSADDDSRNFVQTVTDGVAANYETLKSVILKYSHGFELNRIYKTDLAVLLVACYEILYTDTPKAVVANEAVEITKAYSDTQSYSFVNGVLASVIKQEAENE